MSPNKHIPMRSRSDREEKSIGMNQYKHIPMRNRPEQENKNIWICSLNLPFMSNFASFMPERTESESLRYNVSIIKTAQVEDY